jgi:YVTN family beta-propeller protein
MSKYYNRYLLIIFYNNFMKKISLFFICISAFILKTTGSSAQNYVLDKTISIPGNGGYDYAFIDQVNHHLYTSHGTAVNVIDLQTERVIGTISGMKGVHGIAISNELGRGFITDGKASAVVAFDINTLQVIKTIPVTGKGPDGIIYDPFSKKIFAFEGDSNSAIVIDPQSLSQTATVDLGGGPEFAVANGNGLIYNNLEDKSSLDVIDTKNLTVIHTFPLAPCGGPTGLAMDKVNQRLFTVCRENKGMSVIDAATGKVIQTLAIGAGVDAVIYDTANKLVIASNGDGTASIFRQNSPDSYKLVQTLQTQFKAKTMAMDTTTHKLYFPVADFQPGTKTQVPDSFKVLVYKLK